MIFHLPPANFISPLGQLIAMEELGTVTPFERYLHHFTFSILRQAGTTWSPRTPAKEIAQDTGLSEESARKYLRAFLVWVEAEPELFPELSLTRVARKWRTAPLRLSGGGEHFTFARNEGRRGYSQGLAKAQNPYKPDGALWTEWNEGWDEGKLG